MKTFALAAACLVSFPAMAQGLSVGDCTTNDNLNRLLTQVYGEFPFARMTTLSGAVMVLYVNLGRYSEPSWTLAIVNPASGEAVNACVIGAGKGIDFDKDRLMNIIGEPT